jgi:hypothetical protein
MVGSASIGDSAEAGIFAATRDWPPRSPHHRRVLLGHFVRLIPGFVERDAKALVCAGGIDLGHDSRSGLIECGISVRRRRRLFAGSTPSSAGCRRLQTIDSLAASDQRCARMLGGLVNVGRALLRISPSF